MNIFLTLSLLLIIISYIIFSLSINFVKFNYIFISYFNLYSAQSVNNQDNLFLIK